MLLCILLFLWMGGSSYFYICKINDHCSPKEEVFIEPDEQVDKPEIVIEKEQAKDDNEQVKEEEDLQEVEEVNLEAKEEQSVTDAVSKARKFINNNPSKTIYFNYAKYEKGLSEADSEYIELLKLYIENNPGKKVFLSGHSDSIGTPEGLMFASYQRVVFVKGALIKAGIPISLISSKSMGDSTPEGSNSTVQGRAKNRRVEISIRN